MGRLQTVIETAKRYLYLESQIENLQCRLEVAKELENMDEVKVLEKSLTYIDSELKKIVAHTSKAVNKPRFFVIDCICRYELYKNKKAA